MFVRNLLLAESRKIIGVDFSRSLDFHFDTDINFDMYTLEDGLAELDTNLDDVGDVAGSTVGGATTGAIIGSFIPGAGTLVGAAVGASLGFLGSLGAKASGDGGVSSAKESISDVIDRSRKSVESKIDIDFININN